LHAHQAAIIQNVQGVPKRDPQCFFSIFVATRNFEFRSANIFTALWSTTFVFEVHI